MQLLVLILAHHGLGHPAIIQLALIVCDHVGRSLRALERGPEPDQTLVSRPHSAARPPGLAAVALSSSLMPFVDFATLYLIDN